MKCLYSPPLKCKTCKTRASCEDCVDHWAREKRRNRCPSCHQLHWTRILFEDSHLDICKGLQKEYKELPQCPVILSYMNNPDSLTVGNFLDLYVTANFSRFAVPRSLWISETFIKSLPTCQCIYSIRNLSLSATSVGPSSASSATGATSSGQPISADSAESA
jgi:hypothetical protein